MFFLIYNCLHIAQTLKIDKNKYADKRQYEAYKNILGKNFKFNKLEDFIDLKYNNIDEWDLLNSYKISIEIGELTPLASFDLYKDVSKTIDDKLVGLKTVNNIQVRSKSKHFIARVIGSVGQKRNGVDIDDVLDALLNGEIKPIKVNKNEKSQRIYNNKVLVSVNPDTGILIQVNPYVK